MQVTTFALFVLAAAGVSAAAATPESGRLHVRNAEITYEGTCKRAKNECEYTGQNGKKTFVKCPTFANKKCTKDGAKCEYDSVTRKVTCD